jgi:hypothetical protein
MNLHRPFLKYFRTTRMRTFKALTGVKGSSRVIDVGGTRFVWSLLDPTPDVTLINPVANDSVEGRFQSVRGDGTKLPWADNSFDICFSNSVIEHVGDWEQCRAFASEVRRIAPTYFVQTPNRGFFVEPHLIGAFVHWLPRATQYRIVRWVTIWGLVRRPSRERVAAMLDGIRLLNAEEMQELFPDAVLVRERFLGMTKSLIAVRVAGQTQSG